MTGRLHPDDIEAIARRVVELEAERASVGAPALVDASTLARQLGMSRAFVYEHRHELGAVLVGGGSRPRLRFNPDAALAAFTALTAKPQPPEQPEQPARQKPRRTRPTSSAPLLPIAGERS